MAAPHIAIYCCTEAATWHRVLEQSAAGVLVDASPCAFDAVWAPPASMLPDEPPAAPRRFVSWESLDVPLPHRGNRCWGYALTYPEHRNETVKSAVFRFLKEGTVLQNSAPIRYQPHLDFELEIGVLMHRDTPDRFGYFLANDLTNRGIQVHHYDPRDPAPGFTLAKRFPGSLRAGPLLAVGNASLWPTLTATLTLNNQLRQSLRAADCHLDPAALHADLFREHDEGPWLLAATGTTAGTLFRSPKPLERLAALVRGGLSVKRARRAWLDALAFLAPGDTLTLESPVLGRSEARVEAP